MSSPSLRPPTGDRSRQKILLKLTVAGLLAIAFLILLVPGGIPKPIRMGIALSDLMAAAAIWFLGQRRLRD